MRVLYYLFAFIHINLFMPDFAGQNQVDFLEFMYSRIILLVIYHRLPQCLGNHLCGCLSNTFPDILNGVKSCVNQKECYYLYLKKNIYIQLYMFMAKKLHVKLNFFFFSLENSLKNSNQILTLLFSKRDSCTLCVCK